MSADADIVREAFTRVVVSEHDGEPVIVVGHNTEAAESALDRLVAERAALETALREIAEQQPKTVQMIEHNGFVFDDIGREPGNWQHLAFSIYTDLCQVDSIAQEALAASAEEGKA